MLNEFIMIETRCGGEDGAGKDEIRKHVPHLGLEYSVSVSKAPSLQ